MPFSATGATTASVFLGFLISRFPRFCSLAMRISCSALLRLVKLDVTRDALPPKGQEGYPGMASVEEFEPVGTHLAALVVSDEFEGQLLAFAQLADT